MSEMAKYLKKRRISLHDIIFKNRKGSREEPKKGPSDERVVVQVVTEKGAVGNVPREESRQCSPRESGGRFITVSSSAPGSESVVDRSNLEIGSAVGEGRHSLIMHDDRRIMKKTRQINSGSGENSSGSDTSERFPCKSDSESSEENFIMSRYFKSMTLSDDENQPSSSSLGLPTIDTGSSRSLSAIPWSEMKKDEPLSRSCYEICSNRTPGTSCGTSCSPSFTRRLKQGKSPMTYWSNTGSESDIIDIIPLSSAVMLKTTSRTKQQSRRETLSPLNLAQLESSQRSSSCKSLKREPSSLHVSPNRSPNMSGYPTPSPSSVMSGETLPPAFSPFAECPVVSHHSLRPGSAVMLPVRGLNLLPLRPSTSNPNINQATNSLQHSVPSRLLRPVQFSPLTRSNPNLYIDSPPDNDSSRSISPSSLCSPSPSTSPRLLSLAPIPIPPSSPRPISRCRRSPRVKKTETEFQHTFDNI